MNIYINSVLVVVAMATLYSTEVKGQSYHFSNGWQPGGKRSSMMDVCHFRSEVKALIYKLIEDEAFRMINDQSCYGGLAAYKSMLKKDLGYAPIDDRK